MVEIIMTGNGHKIKPFIFEIVDSLLDKEFVNYELYNDDSTIKVTTLKHNVFLICILDEGNHVSVKFLPMNDELNARNLNVTSINDGTAGKIKKSLRRLLVDLGKDRPIPVTDNNDTELVLESLRMYPHFSFSKTLNRIVFDESVYPYIFIDGFLHIIVNGKLMNISTASIVLQANKGT